MSREIELHLAAEAEIEEAGDYLNERTPGEGARFALAVDAALESSRRSPRTGQSVELKRSKTEVRRKAVKPHNYQVVYAVYDVQAASGIGASAAARSARPLTASLRYAWARWLSTVRTDKNSSSAIVLLG